jgi:two-component system response regulator NreC
MGGKAGNFMHAGRFQYQKFGGQMPTKILIVYRFPLVFQALKALMEGEGFRVMGHQDSPEAVSFAMQFAPDIVIVDIELPGPSGLDCARRILDVIPNTRIIVLSKHSEEFRVRAALELGIRGYVLKTRTADELLRSIQEVSHGRTYFSPEIAHVVADLVLEPLSNRGPVRRASQLTDRERQVVTLIAEGNSTKEVAARLGISVKTADCHRTRIMDKLNVHQTANLVRYAIREGYIEA